ncbi:ABC transporter ATP-binding protein [Bosea sp. PAMC 26642]|uniref:ABC transporter ATP-binding protein n=1 Tax=Bosea sp. (strain PAMC 26642) TaxID=1792307 RepID=UPI00076FE365|nr:ABC transporter ATP-binding protein [Bosea sp. PAMC 26642]AMJ63228.1 nitrate ABC transporter ATP-binding protein [Bosea sp. PAMC 26642]
MSIEASESFVAIERVSFSHGAEPATVDGVDWTIPRGAVHCLVGRSGCGKTTLLKLAAGLLLPDEGDVRIDGLVLRGPGPRIGFVFQSSTLLDWLTVLDNVLLPISLKRRLRPQDHDKALDLLARVSLEGLAARYPHELSGGQQSRVAVARALVADPALLLLDEPFAALDALTREELQDDLLALCAEHSMTALFVTHDIAEAVYLGDRVAVMAAGRLHHQLTIDLPRPRGRDLRYGQPFNALCRELRQAMDAAA